MKNIYLIVAPSGTGKTTLVEKLARDHGFMQVESYTTRQPRYPGETGHIFVTDEEFDQLGEVFGYGEFDGARYGVTEAIINSHDLYCIEPAGVRDLLKRYKGPKGVKVIGLTASYDERYARMKKRGDDPEAIKQRLIEDEKIFFDRNNPISFDFQLHADGIEETAQAVREYIAFHEKYDYDLRIYQIIPKLDAERVCFAGSDVLRKMQGGAAEVHVNFDIYDEVWAGDMKVTDLEDVYMFFNSDNRPNADSMRSLSCSDIVEIRHNKNLSLNGFWFCDTRGWKKVEGGMIKFN